jgi:putative heme-binding domain-containing protein
LFATDLVRGDGLLDLYRTIARGVPDTTMGPQGLSRWETATVALYVHSMRKGKGGVSAGNPTAGREVFFEETNCSLCHAIDGKGGRLGPDLAGIGRSRSLEYLTAKVRNPNDNVMEEFQTVTVVTRAGQTIRGRRLNEDSFSIQLMAEDESLYLYLKRDLASVVHERESLMPAYDAQTLSEEQLRDLLAFLANPIGARN